MYSTTVRKDELIKGALARLSVYFAVVQPSGKKHGGARGRCCASMVDSMVESMVESMVGSIVDQDSAGETLSVLRSRKHGGARGRCCASMVDSI